MSSGTRAAVHCGARSERGAGEAHVAVRFSSLAGPAPLTNAKQHTHSNARSCFWHTREELANRAGVPVLSSTRTQRMNVHEKCSQSIAGHGAGVVVGREDGLRRAREHSPHSSRGL
jgi:hypothetical protein